MEKVMPHLKRGGMLCLSAAMVAGFWLVWSRYTEVPYVEFFSWPVSRWWDVLAMPVLLMPGVSIYFRRDRAAYSAAWRRRQILEGLGVMSFAVIVSMGFSLYLDIPLFVFIIVYHLMKWILILMAAIDDAVNP